MRLLTPFSLVLVALSGSHSSFGEEGPASGGPASGEPDDIVRLVRDLADESWEVREAATEALLATGEACRGALESVVAGAAEADPEVRARAETILSVLEESKRAGLQVVLREGLSASMRTILAEKQLSSAQALRLARSFEQVVRLRERLGRIGRPGSDLMGAEVLNQAFAVVDAPLDFSDAVFDRGTLPPVAGIPGATPLGQALEAWLSPRDLVYREKEGRILISTAEEVLAEPATIGIAIEVLAHDDPAIRTKAIDLVSSLVGEDKGYRADATPEERQAAVDLWRGWYAEKKGALVWDAARRKFVDE